MRTITLIIIHCSAVRPDQQSSAAQIDSWHKDRGFKGIGYHYFINGGSIVQDKKKPWEDIYECFKSAGLTIDKLTEVGVDANDIAQLF